MSSGFDLLSKGETRLASCERSWQPVGSRDDQLTNAQPSTLLLLYTWLFTPKWHTLTWNCLRVWNFWQVHQTRARIRIVSWIRKPFPTDFWPRAILGVSTSKSVWRVHQLCAFTIGNTRLHIWAFAIEDYTFAHWGESRLHIAHWKEQNAQNLHKICVCLCA